MTKAEISGLHKLPVKEKLRLVQDLWDDIAAENSLSDIPAGHKKILDERIAKINAGKASFKPWSEIQKKYKKTG